VNDGAPERVVLGVEDERREGLRRVAFWGRDAIDDRLENLLDPDALLGGAPDVAEGVEAQFGVDLLQDTVHVRRQEVDLVDDGDDGQVVLHGQVEIGDRLGLDALGGVDQQEHPLAGGERPRHLVRKIHMARRVDQVENVVPPVLRAVGKGDGLALDRDPPLTLDVHVVEQLVAEVAVLDHARVLDEPVGQGRLAVVDVGDDAEVADVFHRDAKLPRESCETVLQGSFKASLRERFLANRNDRGATCLSPEGEFVAEQCRELRTVAKRF